VNLYQRLDILPEASGQDVKRAYFRLVKRFTPEKDPDAFMRLREAYETLSDEVKRRAYDNGLSRFEGTPGEVTAAIMKAEGYGDKGMWDDAVNTLEKSGYFEHNAVQCALCRLYIDMDKSGKAVKTAEKLVKENPGNTDYLRLRAEAYFARGWANKAYDVRGELERIEPGNEDNTAALLFGETEQAPFFFGQSIEAIEAKSGKAPLLCAYAVCGCLRDKYDIQIPNPWNDPLFAANKLAEHTAGISGVKREQVRVILITKILKGIYNKDCYEILPRIDQTIKNIGAEELFQRREYEIVSLGHSAKKAVQAGIPKSLVALPLMRRWSQIIVIGGQTREDFANESLALEMDILTDVRRFIPYIKRFQNKFSEYFSHAADFLDMVSQSGEHKIHNEISKRIHRSMRVTHRLTLEWLGEWDFNDDAVPEERIEPVRVVKVGRNEPCPCGSGKKHKKCCGNH